MLGKLFDSAAKLTGQAIGEVVAAPFTIGAAVLKGAETAIDTAEEAVGRAVDPNAKPSKEKGR